MIVETISSIGFLIYILRNMSDDNKLLDTVLEIIKEYFPPTVLSCIKSSLEKIEMRLATLEKVLDAITSNEISKSKAIAALSASINAIRDQQNINTSSLVRIVYIVVSLCMGLLGLLVTIVLSLFGVI